MGRTRVIQPVIKAKTAVTGLGILREVTWVWGIKKVAAAGLEPATKGL